LWISLKDLRNEDFLLCIFCISASYAKTLIIDPLDKAGLLSFLADVKKQDQLILGFDVSKASVFEKEKGKTYLINPKGQNLYVYEWILIMTRKMNMSLSM
jgi:hypothetical protein